MDGTLDEAVDELAAIARSFLRDSSDMYSNTDTLAPVDDDDDDDVAVLLILSLVARAVSDDDD